VLKRSPNSTAGRGTSAEILFEQYLDKVFSYVSFWVNNTQLAEDLTLKAFKQVSLVARDCDRDSENFSVSLFTAARRVLRGNRSQTRTPVFDFPPEAGDEALQKFRKGLAALSPQEKELVALKLGSGLSNRCIGRILGLSEAEIGMYLCRVLNQLNGCL
jgi:DNA-directed RNA polymerase specialized sigma24 family protein